MHKILAGLWLICFIYIAFWGFLSMHNGEFLGCLTGSGTECPGVANVLDFLNFHIGVYKVFSTAVFALVISLILLVCLSILTSFYRLVEVDDGLPTKRPLVELKNNYFEKIIHWLSLLVLSPNLN